MTIKKLFRWSLLILWLILVVFLSCQSGNDSGGLSHWMADNIFGIPGDEFHAILRSCAHFSIHFILAILMYAAAYYSYDNPRAFATILGLLVAISDELLQFHIPGRYPELSDIVVNSAGILLGVLISATIAPKKNRPLV